MEDRGDSLGILDWTIRGAALFREFRLSSAASGFPHPVNAQAHTGELSPGSA